MPASKRLSAPAVRLPLPACSFRSYRVREASLDAPKEERPGNKHYDREYGGQSDHLRLYRARPQDRPARTFNEGDRRIDAVDQAVLLRNDRRRISDRTCEHPHLEQEWHRMHEIAVLHVQR